MNPIPLHTLTRALMAGLLWLDIGACGGGSSDQPTEPTLPPPVVPPPTPPAPPAPPAPSLGSIEVVTSTINLPSPAPSYRITIDGERRTTVPADGTTRLSDLATGTRRVRLEGVAPPCRVGVDTTSARVSDGGVSGVAFVVICPGTVQNGDRILFAAFTTDWDLWTMAPDGSDPRILPGMTPSVEQETVWSPDGSRIAFLSNRDGPTNVQLFVMNADGSSQKRRSDVGLVKSGLSWAPDGESVVVASSIAGGGGWDLFVARLDDSPIVRLETADAELYPDWSPDGEEILYSSGASTLELDLWAMRKDGTGPRLIYDSPGTGTMRYARWSPDGRKIAFEAARSVGESRDIMLINSDGTGLINLTKGRGDNREPSWSPDGTMILFGSDRDRIQELDFNLYVMDADGWNIRKLTSMPSRERHPHWRRRQ
jgi:WD40 repeat protein